MKYPARLLYILCAVIFFLAGDVFPHHHHMGAPCWRFDEVDIHHDKETSDEHSSHPFDECTCYLDYCKNFVKAEILHFSNVVKLPACGSESVSLLPNVVYCKSRYICSDIPLTAGCRQTNFLRGPPTFLFS